MTYPFTEAARPPNVSKMGFNSSYGLQEAEAGPRVDELSQPPALPVTFSEASLH